MDVCLAEYRGRANVHSFCRYVVARFKREQEQYLFRFYVAEQMRLQAQGKYIGVKWHELVHPPEAADVLAVIDDLTERAGLVMNDG